ncbi:MAG: hypothetical protein ABI169_07165 [Chitinophagaceae bacterium]
MAVVNIDVAAVNGVMAEVLILCVLHFCQVAVGFIDAAVVIINLAVVIINVAAGFGCLFRERSIVVRSV